uniref:CSC1/OSCA1-like cytosolic domain-containing protein n=1 Tax=Bicosoecida sp. CB-2014 TaxID=1486930 RepID=A0A7S1CHA1_9STRA
MGDVVSEGSFPSTLAAEAQESANKAVLATQRAADRRLSAFKADCGPNRHYKHLSVARAIAVRDESHPRRIVLNADKASSGLSRFKGRLAGASGIISMLSSSRKRAEGKTYVIDDDADTGGAPTDRTSRTSGDEEGDLPIRRTTTEQSTASSGSKASTNKKLRTLRTQVSGDVDDHAELYSLAPFPICGTDAGAHAMCAAGAVDSEFTRFGLGISLYYKFLKAMGIVMLALSIACTVPMLFYADGVGVGSGAVAGGGGVVNLDWLLSLSVGNLGDGTPLCADATEDGELELVCPPEHVLGTIHAYYGQPSGTCDCPVQRTPSPTCPATELEDGSCDPPGEACIPALRRRVHHPDGNVIIRGSCCATTRDVAGLPAFPDLDITRTAGCDSPHATRVVTGVCVGRSSCILNASPTHEYTWQPIPGAPCSRQIETNNNRCESKLTGGVSDSVGHLTRCDRSSPLRLVVVARCVQTHLVLSGGGQIAKDVLAVLVALIDIAICASFLMAMRWLREREEDEEWKVENTHIRASDYTIELVSIPKHRDLQSLDRRLRKHFERVLSDPKASWTGQAHNVRVADINFGVRHSELIAAFKKRGKMLRMLELQQKRLVLERHSTVKNMAELDLSKVSTRSLAPVHDSMAAIKKQDRLIDDLQRDAQQTAVRAYITFADREGFNRAMEQYASHSRIFQPLRLRLGGSRLHVRRAPDPSGIIWENLQYTGCSRWMRGVLTGLVSLALVFASALVLFAVEDAKRGVLTAEEGLDCNALPGDVLNKSAVVVDELFDFFDADVGESGRLSCYCDAFAKEHGAAAARAVRFDDTSLAVPAQLIGEPTWCSAWADDQLVASGLTGVLAFLVVVVNLLLRVLVNQMVPLERPHTRSEDMLSRMRKLFGVQLVNTGFLIALVNTRIPGVPAGGLLKGGTFDDFHAEWYATVGVPIVLSMVANVLSPHFFPLGSALVLEVRRCWDRRCTCDRSLSRQVTQSHLEHLYLGPEFHLADRYSQAVMTIWVAFSYSAGMPLLLPLAACFFFVTFWVDKILFVRFYRRPPTYDASIARSAAALMPWAIVVHFVVGTWMLSNPGVFVSSNIVAGIVGVTGGDGAGAAEDVENALLVSSSMVERLSSPHAIIMMTALFAAAAYALLDELWQHNKGLARRWCKSVKVRRQDALEYPPYIDALRTAFFEKCIAESTVKAALRDEYSTVLAQRHAASLAASRTAAQKAQDAHPGESVFLAGGTASGRPALLSESSETKKRYITGIPTYDLNHNPRYRKLMGLDTLVDHRQRRGISLHHRRKRHRRSSAEDRPTPSASLAASARSHLNGSPETASPPVKFGVRGAAAVRVARDDGDGDAKARDDRAASGDRVDDDDDDDDGDDGDDRDGSASTSGSSGGEGSGADGSGSGPDGSGSGSDREGEGSGSDRDGSDKDDGRIHVAGGAGGARGRFLDTIRKFPSLKKLVPA